MGLLSFRWIRDLTEYVLQGFRRTTADQTVAWGLPSVAALTTFSPEFTTPPTVETCT